MLNSPMSSTLRVACAGLLCAALLPAQTFPASSGPVTADLSSSLQAVVGPGETRFQQLYELDPTQATQIEFREIELRADGPSHSGLGLASIDEMELWVGVTDCNVDEAQATFDSNLNVNLELFAQKFDEVVLGDIDQGQQAEPWGGLVGELRFVAPQLVKLEVPAGSCLVVELRIRGGSDQSFPISLDFEDLGHSKDEKLSGLEILEGDGCVGPQGTNVFLDIDGDLAPGGSYRFSGSGYAPNAPVFVFVGPDLVRPRIRFPNTPCCWSDLNFATSVLAEMPFTDLNGRFFMDDRPANPIPRLPSLRGRLLYFQAVSPIPISDQNKGGVVSSNYRTVTLGVPRPTPTRGFVVLSTTDADGVVGEVARPGGIAMRLR